MGIKVGRGRIRFSSKWLSHKRTTKILIFVLFFDILKKKKKKAAGNKTKKPTKQRMRVGSKGRGNLIAR